VSSGDRKFSSPTKPGRPTTLSLTATRCGTTGSDEEVRIVRWAPGDDGQMSCRSRSWPAASGDEPRDRHGTGAGMRRGRSHAFRQDRLAAWSAMASRATISRVRLLQLPFGPFHRVSGFMPLMAWAYMSTRVLDEASDALRWAPGVAGPAANWRLLEGTSLGPAPRGDVLQ